MSLANCGSDENKKLHGGKAGDQTGKEYRVMSFYFRPWTCVLRYPDLRVGEELAKVASAAANNNKIGYDQHQRLTFYENLKNVGWDPSKITTPCETDCSASTSALIIAVGHRLGIKELQTVNPSLTTSIMRKALTSVGFDVLTDKKYLTSDDYLLPGDVLLYDGHHAAINLDRGKMISSDSITAVARDVIAGKYGSGEARRANLVKSGYNPSIVQARVNELLKGKS